MPWGFLQLDSSFAQYSIECQAKLDGLRQELKQWFDEIWGSVRSGHENHSKTHDRYTVVLAREHQLHGTNSRNTQDKH